MKKDELEFKRAVENEILDLYFLNFPSCYRTFFNLDHEGKKVKRYVYILIENHVYNKSFKSISRKLNLAYENILINHEKAYRYFYNLSHRRIFFGSIKKISRCAFDNMINDLAQEYNCNYSRFNYKTI